MPNPPETMPNAPETMSETTQDTALGERLATQIRTAGPMGVDSFMAACQISSMAS